MKSSILRTLVCAILLSATLWGQKAATPVGPATADPDLASTTKALEDALRSTGRVTWTQNTPNVSDGQLTQERKAHWEELENVVVDPRTCSLRVVRQNQYGTQGYSYYLDEISGVQVLTTEDFADSHDWLSLRPGYRADVQPVLWSVVVSAWGPFDLKFPTKEAAEKVGALLSESVKLCSAVPMTPQMLAAPSLPETLGFITNKLISQGHVESTVTFGFENGSSGTVSRPVDYLEANVNLLTCSARIRSVVDKYEPPYYQLSFRHISKIEVLSYKDADERSEREILASSHARITAASPTFVLEITSPGGEKKSLYFSDETMANRVAQAMTHAAELCGGGSQPEPF